jgi:hypothetical protein
VTAFQPSSTWYEVGDYISRKTPHNPFSNISSATLANYSWLSYIS